MSALRETAHAKINLALHVRERMADGYHRIETLFAFCEDGDGLEGEAAARTSLTIAGPFAAGLGAGEEPGAGEDNLVLRAANALAAEAGVREGAAIRLDKRLPVAAGIGGGSADAAAALRLLARLWRVELPDARLMAIAGRLGADVPACLASRTVGGSGRGDRLHEADGADGAALGGMPVLLVNPGVPLSTAAVFAGWDGVDRGPMSGDWRAGRNDLEPAARALRPEIGLVLRRLAGLRGATCVRMSGSGATCFALFDDAAACQAADGEIRDREPGWWRLCSRLR